MTAMTKVLRALSPRRQRAESLSRAPTAPEGSPASGTQRQGSRTLFSRKRARAQELPDLEKTDAEFEKDWGISKAEEVRLQRCSHTGRAAAQGGTPVAWPRAQWCI